MIVFLLDDTYVQCQSNVNNTYALFGDLGFNVSKEKSITQPTQVIEHLGFVLNSIDMTVSLTKEKIETIIQLGQDILKGSLVQSEKLPNLLAL